MITPKGNFYCTLCSILVRYKKRYYVESHRKSQRHKRVFKRKNSKQAKQVFIKKISLEFIEKVISAFLAADISLYKLNYPSLKSLFESLGKELPSETVARSIVTQLAERKENCIQETLQDKQIFVVIDETEINGQKFINCLV